MRSTKSHPTAEWLYTELRKEYPKISMGTVYRNLSRLSENGDILKISTGDSSEHYDGFTHDHNHFVCRICGGVSDIDVPITYNIDRETEKATGNKVEKHSLVFYGICSECKKNI